MQAQLDTSVRLLARRLSERIDSYREARASLVELGRAVREIHNGLRVVHLTPSERASLIANIATIPLTAASIALGAPLTTALSKTATLLATLYRSGRLIDGLRDASLTLRLLLEELG
ncbi:hypothetical protein [Hyperthermus butylicus]|uniref:Uncharacterized protein n=1 Tax=Hyperthermus butylicus (strain DSM 5456 / JCM 9403 / PLM1-5) TaxID=415426 RepID=A2BLR5_HYPBU|nr:hypothetical protein [Hyperthermus butylicus]ABM80926.1 hypothetical protein Hbut_1083 [Hyperthermus butylicus DSM 5456]